MDSFLPRNLRSIATEFEDFKGGRFFGGPIVGNQIGKIESLIQHSQVKTKQTTSQVIVAVPTQDAAPRQSVIRTKDRRRVAKAPRTGKSTDRPQQVYHTDAAHHKTEISVKMTTRSFGVKHGQLQSGEQPYTAAGYGKYFSHKFVLNGLVFIF
jgi:hypothetical protein